jgi:hypothetical protein
MACCTKVPFQLGVASRIATDGGWLGAYSSLAGLSYRHMVDSSCRLCALSDRSANTTLVHTRDVSIAQNIFLNV